MRSRNVGKAFWPRTWAARLSIIGLSLAVWSCAHQTTAKSAAALSPSIRLESFAEDDSAGFARAIERACRRAESRSSCYESTLDSAASAGRVRLAMGALGQLGAMDREVKRDGHVYAHAIGIAAGKRPGDIAQVFSQCSESYQSGCYHGVIQARFAALDSVGAKEVNGICDPFRVSESQRWLRFQCVHGVGHGLTTLNDHDLPRGLSGCDLLRDPWDRSSCYGGAFMENIINVTNPHHPAGALAHSHGQAEGHESGHDHEHTASFKPVDLADPLYPCSILANRYQSACYQMQTSVMLYINKGDIAATAHACDRAPTGMVSTCYASLGRDVSSRSMQNHAEAIRMCSLGTPRHQPWCYFGLVKNIIDLNARPADGISLCRDVPASSGKLLCYVAVGEQIGLLAPDHEERRSMCKPSEALMMDACLFGARVRLEPPAGFAEMSAELRSK